ncbi:MAG: PEP-CTERM sorting domain-containing protein [Gemmataceae bacterium]|nr:PEP-CTERM sorting domain-containing protein [Gemmataceae bacterium]
MNVLRTTRSLLAALLAALAAPAANAAYITIDDSDPDSITITAGDFEGGFFVDGDLLTIGLGDSGSITLPDGGYLIAGSWIDLGEAGGDRVDVSFALSTDPTAVTSGVEFGAGSDGFFATLTGSFGGFTGFPYFFTADPTFPQDGSTVPFGVAFLSGSFTSEAAEPAAVPEPATLALVAGVVPFAAAVRRRRSVA